MAETKASVPVVKTDDIVPIAHGISESAAPVAAAYHDPRFSYTVKLSDAMPMFTAFDGQFPVKIEFEPNGEYVLTYQVRLSPADFAKVIK